MAKISTSTSAFIRLYAAYALSCLGDRLWQFAIVFVMEHLGGIRLVSANQFLDSIASMFVMPYVGSWLDQNNRKHGILTVLMANNFSIAISSGFLVLCLMLEDGSPLYYMFLVLSIAFCALSKCASDGESTAFTKDWIVVMEGKGSLSSRNSIMRTIDQSSAVVAPLVTGYLIIIWGHRKMCLLFIAWNLLSWAVERYLLSKVYDDIGELHVRDEHSRDELETSSGSAFPLRKSNSILRRLFAKPLLYWNQTAFSAAFGLALLYLTVLGFDGLALSYTRSQGMPDDLLGVFRSVAALFGFLGAGAYTLMDHRIGVRRTGLVGLIAQQVFLWFCVASVWLPGSPFDPFASAALPADETEKLLLASNATAMSLLGENGVHPMKDIDWQTMTVHGRSIVSATVLLAGIAISRFGLWVADLSITQIMQESIPEAERGTVNGTQVSLCHLISVIKDVAVILLPDPRKFGLLILASVAFITAGMVFYCWYLYKTRNHRWKEVKTDDVEHATDLPTDDSHRELLDNHTQQSITATTPDDEPTISSNGHVANLVPDNQSD